MRGLQAVFLKSYRKMHDDVHHHPAQQREYMWPCLSVSGKLTWMFRTIVRHLYVQGFAGYVLGQAGLMYTEGPRKTSHLRKAWGVCSRGCDTGALVSKRGLPLQLEVWDKYETAAFKRPSTCFHQAVVALYF